MAKRLKNYLIPSFKNGYNSFPSSKTAIADTEVPYGQNVYLSDVGSVQKRAGKSRYGAEIASGKAIMGGGVLKNGSYNAVIVASGTAWYKITSTTKTALTGVSFTDSKATRFVQAFDKLYGANNTDNLAYTNDASTVTAISSNGNIGDWPVFYNQCIYMTNSTYEDRIYYSNPYALDLSTSPPTLTGFSDANMFNVDLTATPKKNAGFIVLSPGSGVKITCIFKDSQAGADYIYAFTKKHGIWRINYASVNADGSIAHTIVQIITSGGCPSGKSVGKLGNDTWYFGGDNMYAVGEQAQFQNIRRLTKGARIRNELQAVSVGDKDDVAFGYFKDRVWISYSNSTYNNSALVYDVPLNAWSCPLTNINANFFLNYEEDDGTERLLAGSSLSTDSYVYELETGSDDEGVAIDAEFETKSTDCGIPGVYKLFAYIDVFYTTVYGTLDYEVFIDETSSATGTLQLGNSTDYPAGVGSQTVGTFAVGLEYNPNTTFASLAQNNNFRIDCGYALGKKISVRFSNAVVGEQFRINSVVVWFKEMSPYFSQ